MNSETPSWPEPIDQYQVYLAWPESVIREAYEEFAKVVYGGLYESVEEIRAGVHGLDFLCRASIIVEPLRTLIDAALNEAEIRIELEALRPSVEAAEKEAAEIEKENALNFKKVESMLRSNIQFFRSISRGRFHANVEDIRESVGRRVSARLAK
jgi:hypothetical protein